jgi:hypothetical protein
VTSRPVGTEAQIGWLTGIVKAILVLNLFDAIFTLLWVRAGLATEANEMMATLVNHHAVLFVVTKLGLVSLGSLLLYRYRRRPAAVIAIFIVFVVYYLILLYHLSYSNTLIRNSFGS